MGGGEACRNAIDFESGLTTIFQVRPTSRPEAKLTARDTKAGFLNGGDYNQPWTELFEKGKMRRDLQQTLNDTSGWCCRNRMALNPTKTKCMLMATRQKHRKQQLSLNLNFDTTPVDQISKHRLLGVTVDEQLKWQRHINNICRTISRNIFLLSKLSPFVSHKAKLGFFFGHIMSHINYVKCMGWMCLCAHEATVLSPQTCDKILNAKS